MKHLVKLLRFPDVLVIGGGSAGVAATVGASEAGADVVLLEKNGFLGGKATAAYVGTVCGLYYRSENPTARFVMEGFPKTFAEQLQEYSQTQPVHYKNGLHFLPYDRFAFMQLCDQWVGKHATSLGLHSYMHNVEVDGRTIVSLTATVYNQRVKFHPKVVIDTTGEAVIAQMLDLSQLFSDEYQASAQVFALVGLGSNDHQVLTLALMRALRKGISEGQLSEDCQRLSIVPGTLKNEQALFKMGIPVSVNNEENQVMLIETFARKLIQEVVSYLKANTELFKNTQISMVAPEVGIRTGPRHRGRYVLHKLDVLECRKFEDSIARGAWPIEHWHPNKKPVMDYFAEDDFYDISAACLESSQLKNLYFAGRNLSADDQAIASARVMGTCLATGYAAGYLAAGFAKGRKTAEMVALIQEKMKLN